MSYEEESPPKEYTASSALVTPPKDPNEQPLLAATHVSTPIPPSGNSFEPSRHDTEEQFTPVGTIAEYQGADLEPLPFNENPFDGSLNAHQVWQLVYSPIQATPGLGGRVVNSNGDFHSPINANDGSADSKSDESADNANKPPQSSAVAAKGNGSGEKPPAFPHHPWQMYPPPPYYMHPYYYGYHHQHDRPHPALYPKPGRYHHAQNPPPYGQFGKPPLLPIHEPAVPECIQHEDVTDYDVICGRGGAVNNHPGNRRFRGFIQDFKYQYLRAHKQNKPSVAKRVLDAVAKSNPPGRFLVKYPSGYYECSEDRSREKASQALREAAAKLRKQGHGAKHGAAPTAYPLKQGVLLPNELQGSKRQSEPPECPSEFEPPHDPPRKKIKQEEAV